MSVLGVMYSALSLHRLCHSFLNVLDCNIQKDGAIAPMSLTSIAKGVEFSVCCNICPTPDSWKQNDYIRIVHLLSQDYKIELNY